MLEERNASAMKRFFDVVKLGLWSMLSTAALYNEHNAIKLGRTDNLLPVELFTDSVSISAER